MLPAWFYLVLNIALVSKNVFNIEWNLFPQAAQESTNTEVSSTFSLSRAEEQSRMKDLEDSFEDKYTKVCTLPQFSYIYENS